MILLSSAIQHLFYIFPFCYYFAIAAISETVPENLSEVTTSTQLASNNTQSEIIIQKKSPTILFETTPSTMTLSTSSTSTRTTSAVIRNKTSTASNPTLSTSTRKINAPVVSVDNTIKIEINSTRTSQNSKSLLPIILGSVFGGLAVIVLIASIITHVLIKRGYIEVFNQPRTRIKDMERTRIIDSSSSSIGGTNLSQR